MNPKEKEIFESFKELAKDNAGQLLLAGFFMFAMTQKDIRENIDDETVSKMFIIIQLLEEASKLSE